MATSVDKAFRILSYLADHSEKAIGEISENLSIHRSSVYRLVKVLERYGSVERGGSRGSYRLGKMMLQIGSVALSDFGLCQIGRPFIEELRDKTKETTYLTTFSDGEVLYMDYKASTYGIAAMARPGMRLPAHCTSSGKLFLSFDLSFRERVFQKPLKRYSKYTITDLETMRKELGVIQRKEYAICKDEYESGITSIAAPIFANGSAIVAAIAIAGPTSRMKKIAPIIRILKKAASEISEILGEKGRPS
ncbi:MAG: IclR family transcriptional regulator [Thermodesulfobacteriota bacterium]|jgi:DNA-binding IclR family transcriptional regulator